MSEEFDKEAEREKLREKFEEDAEKRSATQRMSELLLGGATMTNQHCDRCGDPLFRDGGETFCPTCRHEEASETQRAPDAASSDAEPAAGQRPDEVEQSAGSPPETGQRTASLSQLPEDAEVVARADDLGAEPPADSRPTGTQPSQPRASQPQSNSSQPRQEPTDASDVADPATELRRAVTETARKANAATDPRTAQAWLEASKEAAEALAALER